MISNKCLQAIHLDPTQHEDAVWAFFDFFHLSNKNPDLNFLGEILEQFATIPYENISKIIKYNLNWHPDFNDIRLPEEVMIDHIQYKLGGTCFSLTFFLHAILAQSGFVCYPVMADMRAGRNIHCCLIAILNNVKYLLDPGYLLIQPMEINPYKPKLFRTEFAGVELRYDVDSQIFNLMTFNKNEKKWRYRFQDRPAPAEEFLQHWLASFGWNSMHGICLTKVVKDGLLFVHKNFMRETTFHSKRNFNIRKNYHSVIHERFGIDKRIIEQAGAALEENMERERNLGFWRPVGN